MAFINDSQLKDELHSTLGKAPGEMSSKWDNIVRRSNVSAYQDIVSRLVARGFSKAQVDLWDRGAEFNVDIGLYWCLVKGGGLEAYDDKFINKLDRREELDTVLVTTSGVIVTPANGGDFGTGSFDTSSDLFVMDEDDGRRGEPTSW